MMFRLLMSTGNVFLSLVLGAIGIALVGIHYPEALSVMLGWARELKRFITGLGLEPKYNIWVELLLEERQLLFMGFTIVARIALSLLAFIVSLIWPQEMSSYAGTPSSTAKAISGHSHGSSILTGALVLGLIGGLMGLAVGLFGFALGSVVAAGGSQNAALFQAVSLGIPILSILGGAVAKAVPIGAGMAMLLSAVGMLWIFGFNLFTAVPITLAALGSLLAFSGSRS